MASMTISDDIQDPTGQRSAAGSSSEDDSTDPYEDLSDDMVKLVAYAIVSIKRDAERIMPKGRDQVIVIDNISKETFTSWIIAKYFQSNGYKELPKEEKIKDEDRKYLRVHFTVARRWSRMPLEFEERQIAALSDIRNRIP